MLQGELRESCKIWLDQWARSAPLHALTPAERSRHHSDCNELLKEVRHMSSMVFGGAFNKESSGLVFSVCNALRAMGNYPMGVRFCNAFISKLRRGGNRLALANILNIQGGNHIGLGMFAQGLTYLTESKTLFHEEGEDGLIFECMVGMNIGNCFGYLHQYQEAMKHHQEALATFETIPLDWFERNKARQMDPVFCRKLILGNMGFAYMYQGVADQDPERRLQDLKSAAAIMGEALEIEADPSLDIHQSADAAQNLIYMGHLEEARRRIAELHARIDADENLQGKRSLVQFTEVELEAAQGNWTKAAKLSRATLQASLDSGDIITEYMVSERYLRILKSFVGHLRKVSGDRHGLFFLGGDGQGVLEDVVTFLESKETLEDISHSRAVADLAVALGRALLANGEGQEGALPEPDGDWSRVINLDFLQVAGLVHDLGKLRVPWSVLNFPGEPNPEEWALLKGHVNETVNILLDLDLDSLARITAEHHERLDGSGYPAGIKNLSLMGAILAVADSYVAGITSRPGRRQPPTSQAVLDEILADSGSLYDPRVCNVLAQAVHTGG